MPGYQENPEGYIVFRDGGTCPIAYGAFEEWFPTYDEAMKKAIKIVSDKVELRKEHYEWNSVIVYKGSENYLHKSHEIPSKGERVVFYWTNYGKI